MTQLVIISVLHRRRTDRCTKKRPIHQSPRVQRPDLMEVQPAPLHTYAYFMTFFTTVNTNRSICHAEKFNFLYFYRARGRAAVQRTV